MAVLADVVIAGDVSETNEITVSEVIYAVKDTVVPKTIALKGFESQKRDFGIYEKSGECIKAKRLIAFLRRDAAGFTLLGQETEGSRGLIWLEAEGCCFYLQGDNPGPYLLIQSKMQEQALREEIKQGLADRAQWEKIYHSPVSDERTSHLCRYLLESTSPDAPNMTYRRYYRNEIVRACNGSIAPLVLLMKHRGANDSLAALLDSLEVFGSAAKEITPELIAEMQKKNGPRDLDSMMELIKRISADECAPYLLTLFNKVPQPHSKAVVAAALAQFKYKNAFADLENTASKLVPRVGEGGSDFVAILDALVKIDSERAKPLVEKYYAEPHLQDSLKLVWKMAAGTK